MKPKKVIAWRRRAAAAEELAREAQRTERSVEFQKIVAEALVRELRGLRFGVEAQRDELRSRGWLDPDKDKRASKARFEDCQSRFPGNLPQAPEGFKWVKLLSDREPRLVRVSPVAACSMAALPGSVATLSAAVERLIAEKRHLDLIFGMAWKASFDASTGAARPAGDGVSQ